MSCPFKSFFSCHYDGRVRASFSRSTTTCDKSLCIKVKKKRRPIASFVVTVHLYGRQTFLLAEAKGQLVYLATSRQLQVADGGVGFIWRPSAWVSTRPAPYQKGGHKRNLSAAAAISSITRFSMNWRVPMLRVIHFRSVECQPPPSPTRAGRNQNTEPVRKRERSLYRHLHLVVCQRVSVCVVSARV